MAYVYNTVVVECFVTRQAHHQIKKVEHRYFFRCFLMLVGIRDVWFPQVIKYNNAVFVKRNFLVISELYFLWFVYISFYVFVTNFINLLHQYCNTVYHDFW